MHHKLKVLPVYYGPLADGRKTFEVRDNADRNFQAGDTVQLKEWIRSEGFTGRDKTFKVGYVLPLHLLSSDMGDYVVFTLQPLVAEIPHRKIEEIISSFPKGTNSNEDEKPFIIKFTAQEEKKPKRKKP